MRGPPNTVPELVTFQQDFKKGALLTVVSFPELSSEFMRGAAWLND